MLSRKRWPKPSRLEHWERTLKIVGSIFGIVSSLWLGYWAVNKVFGTSNTRVTIASADKNALYVNVSNTGVKRSYLRNRELTFGALPIENRKLDVIVADTGVVNAGFAPANDTRVGLLVRGLRTKAKSGSSERYTRAEIEQRLDGCDIEVALLVTIAESNEKTRTDRISFKASLIRELILEKLPIQEAEP